MKKQKPLPTKTFWFVREATETEELRVYQLTGCDLHRQEELKLPGTREFDPTKDSKGPEAKIVLTYPKVCDSVWYPETSGNYLICFTDQERPEHLRHIQLHFGTVSSPQRTKAAAARILQEILEKWPDLKPFLSCRKMPCVFCKDHPEAPGGSFVEVPLESLPAPCHPNQVSKFYC